MFGAKGSQGTPQPPRVTKTVGVYDKPEKRGWQVPRSALYAGGLALAAAVAAAVLYLR